MDSLVTAAARALARGDALGALSRVALRDDPPALALRGIAMAQLGDLDKARELLRRAARTFAPREVVARARCVVALAEVALAHRDLGEVRALGGALRALDEHGDRFNALYGRLLSVRRLLLLGRVSAAESELLVVDSDAAPPVLAAIHQLCVADVALRRLRTTPAQASLERALAAARKAAIPALTSEVLRALAAFGCPAARRVSPDGEQPLLLHEVERMLNTTELLVVDGCRRRVRAAGQDVMLARRPILFALLRTLAEAWPDDAARDVLIAEAFAVRRVNASHRARLRVEIGRLRKGLREMASIRATKRGFVLVPLHAAQVAVLAPPIAGQDAALLALLADGEAWSTSALALALSASQRTVQRALAQLEPADQVRSIGRGRSRRWLTPPAAGFTTTLLLPTSLHGG